MENSKIQSDVTDQDVTATEGISRTEREGILTQPRNEAIGLSFTAQESENETPSAQGEEISDQYVTLDQDVSWAGITGTFTQVAYEPTGLAFGEARYENVVTAQTNSASFDEQLMAALLKAAGEQEAETADQNITADQDAPADERKMKLPRRQHGVTNLASLLPAGDTIGEDITTGKKKGLSKIGRQETNLASFGFPQNQDEIMDQPPSVLGEGTIGQSATVVKHTIADQASSVFPTIREEETTDREASTGQNAKAAQKKRRFLQLRRKRRNSAVSEPVDQQEGLDPASLQLLGAPSAQRTTATQLEISNQRSATRQHVAESQARNTNQKKKNSPKKQPGL